MAESDDYKKWAMSRLSTWKAALSAEELCASLSAENSVSYKKVSDDGSVESASATSITDLLKSLKSNVNACNSFTQTVNTENMPAGQLLTQGLGYTIDALQRTIGMYNKTRKDFYEQAEKDVKTIQAGQVQAYQLMAGYKEINDKILKALDE